MAFPTGQLNDIPQIREGEIGSGANIMLSTIDYEDGLNIGRFAKIDSGRLDNLDGSATPNIAGVVVRGTNDLVESTVVGTAQSTFPVVSEKNQSYIRQGLVTVKLAASSGTPAQFGTVYTVNENANADNGNATTVDDDTTDATTAEFIQLMKNTTDIWLIRLK